MVKKVVLLGIVAIALAGRATAESVEETAYKLASEKTHLTFGIGAANDLIGGIVKNGLGEPKNSFTLNTVLGFSYTVYFGSNSVEKIFQTTKDMSANTALGDDVQLLNNAVRKEIAKNSFTYTRIGTAFLIYPLVLQTGMALWPADYIRFEIGLGLPTLLNFGFNVDF